ncbi:MAG: hypothetical protein LBQ16_07120 [Gracilibacteraceae bacterium]|jgi:hypothetical protein|nr:hypothetical protein [Gracilibacteraceae bacterium]
MNWQQICNENEKFFKGANWAECGENDRKTLRLSPRFRFLSAGDLNLKLGVVVAEGKAREEEMLANGLVWANRIGNGVHARLFFVAPAFSQAFLSSLQQLRGRLSCQAVLWREKLHPYFFPVTVGNISPGLAPFFAGPPAEWDAWGKKCNPVARQHLAVVRDYFDALAARRVRTVFRKNSIAFVWGDIDIAEVTAGGGKFVLRTKDKGMMKRVAQVRQGWVDADSRLDNDFRLAVEWIIGWLEGREADGALPELSALTLKMWHEPGFIIPEETGTPFRFPWLKKETGGVQPDDFWYFAGDGRVSVYYPVLARALEGLGELLYYDAVLRENAEAISRLAGNATWDARIRVVTAERLSGELRWHQEYFKEAERFPLIILPENWRQAKGAR